MKEMEVGVRNVNRRLVGAWTTGSAVEGKKNPFIFHVKHKIHFINFIATRGKVSIDISTFLDFLCCRFYMIYYGPSNLPVLRMRVNGSLLVFPFIVYRLTEYVVAGCKSVGGGKNKNKTKNTVKTSRTLKG